MKKFLIVLLAAVLLVPVAANAQKRKSQTGKTKTSQTVKRTKKTKPTSTTASLTPLERKVVGKHMLSLQWISWKYFGTATITKEADGTLRCTGEQLSRGDDSHIGDYLKLDGTVRIVSEKELEFTGSIRTKIWHIAGGEEVERAGTFTIDGTTEICVCDKSRRARQAPGLYYAKYNTEVGRGNEIPIWLFGFMY